MCGFFKEKKGQLVWAEKQQKDSSTINNICLRGVLLLWAKVFIFCFFSQPLSKNKFLFSFVLILYVRRISISFFFCWRSFEQLRDVSVYYHYYVTWKTLSWVCHCSINSVYFQPMLFAAQLALVLSLWIRGVVQVEWITTRQIKMTWLDNSHAKWYD